MTWRPQLANCASYRHWQLMCRFWGRPFQTRIGRLAETDQDQTGTVLRDSERRRVEHLRADRKACPAEGAEDRLVALLVPHLQKPRHVFECEEAHIRAPAKLPQQPREFER